MKIGNYKNNNISFKSGLKPNLVEAIAKTSVQGIEKAFFYDYGVDALFNGSKFYSFGFGAVLNIFEELSHKFKLPFETLPPSIRTFQRKKLIISYAADNFCIPKGGLVLKEEQAFARRSIFMLHRDDLQKIDQELNNAFQGQKRSSSYFLSDIIHEWLHNIHLSLQGAVFIDKFKPNDSLRKTISATIGSYAANSQSKSEIFVEGMTKLITAVLNKDDLHVLQNPLNGLKTMPKEVADIIEKTIS